MGRSHRQNISNLNKNGLVVYLAGKLALKAIAAVCLILCLEENVICFRRRSTAQAPLRNFLKAVSTLSLAASLIA